MISVRFRSESLQRGGRTWLQALGSYPRVCMFESYPRYLEARYPSWLQESRSYREVCRFNAYPCYVACAPTRLGISSSTSLMEIVSTTHTAPTVTETTSISNGKLVLGVVGVVLATSIVQLMGVTERSSHTSEGYRSAWSRHLAFNQNVLGSIPR
jgi:hypothetical protein